MYLPQTTTLKNDSICVQFCTHVSYKTCIETKHENCDRLGPLEMGLAGYWLALLSSPNIIALSVV